MERFTQLAAESAATVSTTPLVTIPNRGGLRAVMMGSLDTTGIVLLRPRTPQFTAQVPLYVSARAPFIGEIPAGVPIDVFSVVVGDPTAIGVTPVPSQLDLVAYDCEPSIPQSRAVQVYNQLVTLDGAGAGHIAALKVTGRKRVRVMWQSLAGNNVTGRADAIGVGGDGSASNPFFGAGGDNGSVGPASGGFIEFSTSGMHNGAPHIIPGVSVFDFVTLSFTAGTAADPISVNIQAWDE